jgi:hypothetical protein
MIINTKILLHGERAISRNISNIDSNLGFCQYIIYSFQYVFSPESASCVFRGTELSIF